LPTQLGTVTVTLTILDGLGTSAQQQIVLSVVPGPVVSLVSNQNTTASNVIAGLPENFSWYAVDLNERRVTSFGEKVTLAFDRSIPSSNFSVYTSAGLAVPEDSVTNFTLRTTDWQNGTLAFSITTTVAGTYTFTVIGPTSLSAPGNRIVWSVTPDFNHLVLFGRSTIISTTSLNATRYNITDRFGNALSNGFLIVQTQIAGTVSNLSSPIEQGTGGSFVWVNYTVPHDTRGELLVINPANGLTLLGPLPIGSGPPRSTVVSNNAVTNLYFDGFILAIAAIGGFLVAQRFRARRRPGGAISSDLEDELAMKRLADGRAHLLALGRVRGSFDLAEATASWPENPPSSAELAEWTEALVSEGLLRAEAGPDGKSRFVLTPAAFEEDDDAPLPVEVDPELFEEALARRDELDKPSEDD
jgi:hypothetical protein